MGNKKFIVYSYNGDTLAQDQVKQVSFQQFFGTQTLELNLVIM